MKPQLTDIDAWGLTHPGKVRKVNQDHFFIASLSRGMTLHGTSLADDEIRQLTQPQRLASLGVIADGVGSSAAGGEAARIAVKALVTEVQRSFQDALFAEASDPDVFSRLLQEAALACHESLLERAGTEGEGRFATTLTLYLGLWPHAFLLQVGDSRCYVYHGGELTQITRDQTLAQALVDQGVLSQMKAQSTRWADVLSSAIGGEEAAPVVTRIVREWGTVVLMCSDGLTKHVSDERIGERIASMTNARQLCEELLQDALDDGGTDNITIAVGRTVPRDES